jgi:2-dehydro-3-deoxyphosphogluconate aldolase/(4S)-4-hydroxy-2-oxoglutarate aldolase
METVKKIEKHQLVVVIRTRTPGEAFEAAKACIRGGVRLVEITFSVPEAHEVIRRLADNEGVTLGAGTVLGIEEARKALDAGASYIVSPHLDEEIVRFTKDAGAVSVPGAATPTEIMRAHGAGADIVKLFPFVELGGLGFLKTIRGPLPFVKYMPSGGVTLDNFADYLAARVSGIIVGSAIVRPELVKLGDWQGIEKRAAGFVGLLKDRKMTSEDMENVQT